MKSILVSVPPEVCERIANGKQTLLLMKRIPKLQTPYMVYMYCTKDKDYQIAPFRFVDGWFIRRFDDTTSYANGSTYNMGDMLNGKVISSFICRGIMHPNDSLKLMAKESCMSEVELDKYAKGKTPYGLRVTDLTIFDTPKELGEFKRECKQYGADNPLCDDCRYYDCCKGVDYDESDCVVDGLIPLIRPPQSWCYVEELSE